MDVAMRKSAETALASVDQDPVLAREQARLVLKEPAIDSGTRSIALRVLGLAARSVSTLSDSVALLRDSVDTALAGDELELAGEASLSLAGSLLLSGQVDLALDQLSLTDGLSDSLVARYMFQRGTILGRIGQSREAENLFEEALQQFRDLGDVKFEAYTEANLGRLNLEVGNLKFAKLHLEKSLALHREMGNDLSEAYQLHNLAEVEWLHGDIATALARFAEARQVLDRLTEVGWEVSVAEGRALFSAGLYEEVVALCGTLDAQMVAHGYGLDRGEALLLQAEALALLGEVENATNQAERASELFASQRRVLWQLRSDLVHARLNPHDDGAHRCYDIGGKLHRLGYRHLAESAWAEAAIYASESGLVDLADRSVARIGRATGASEQKLGCSYAKALLAHRRGERSKAYGLLRSGLAAATVFRRSLGATEMIGASARHVQRFGELGRRMALESGRSDVVFRWAEATRSLTIQSPSLSRPTDETVSELFAQIRSVSRRIESADITDRRELTQQHERLSRKLLARERSLGEGSNASHHNLPAATKINDVKTFLVDRQLLSMFTVGGNLWVQAVTSQGSELADLGSLDEWQTLFSAIGRRVDLIARGSLPAAGDVERVRTDLGQRLSRISLASVLTVLVPPAELLDAPWAIIPPFDSQPLVVSPSVATWMRPPRTRSGRLVFVGGPNLALGDAEVAASAAAHRDAIALTGDAATAQRLLDLLGTASSAHVAAHGQHRRGNAMLSTLLLADGPIGMLELERLAAVPQSVVLSACTLGQSDEWGGSESIGMATAFLRMGSRCVVAGNGLVQDSKATVDLMTRLHQHTSAGMCLAEALFESLPNDATERLPLQATFHTYGASAPFQ